MRGHDIVVVGASAGGVQALIELVSRLPADLPAAVFVVLHTAPRCPNVLPMILARHARMEVVLATDGDPIRPGRIYVAGADYHLLIDDGKIRLNHGPKQHHTRPAVDPLFQTAAAAYGPRVVGVVLTGAGANGVRGMLAIKQHGGIAMIQDPEEALWPSMPANTRRAVGVDYVLPVADLAHVLVDLARDPVEEAGGAFSQRVADCEGPVPGGERSEGSGMTTGAGPTLEFSPACPECGDGLAVVELPELGIFGCAAGHTFASEELLDEQSDELERTLWFAHRIARQQALLADWVAASGRSGGDPDLALRVHQTGTLARRTASALFELLHSGGLEPERSPEP